MGGFCSTCCGTSWGEGRKALTLGKLTRLWTLLSWSPRLCLDRVKMNMIQPRSPEITALHLELIQSIITRMATNSFLLKGWSVSLCVAFFALSSTDARPGFAILAYVPILMFWGLDAYYLCQERLHRKLYDEISCGEHSESFSLDVGRLSSSWGWPRALLATTVAGFHGVLASTVALVLFRL